jgi:hypothetical protein
MRPTTLVLMLALVGCATADNIDTREPEHITRAEAEEPAPPKVKATGFFCTSDPAHPEASVCARSSEACDDLKAQLTKKGAAPGACAQTATAVCFSAAKADALTADELCFPTREACDSQRAHKEKRDDYGQVGACADAT